MPANARFAWLSALCLSNDKSDIEIRVENGKDTVSIPAHSLVLCAHSDVFSAMLESDKFKEGRTRIISLQGYSPRVVEYFLRYLYTKRLPEIIPIEHILELLKISHQYDIPDLLNECNSKLVESFEIESVCEVYLTASLLDLKILQSECLLFIRKNLPDIGKNNLHFVLPLKCLQDSFFVTSSLGSEEILRAQKWYTCVKGETSITTKPKTIITESDNNDTQRPPPYKWLDSLLFDSATSDIEIVAEDYPTAVFPAHSFVLIHQSLVLRSIWERSASGKDNGAKCRIVTPSNNPREVEYLLRFLYNQELPSKIYEKNLISLLRMGKKYQVSSLTVACIQLLAERVSIHNCCQVLVLAKHLNLAGLKEASFSKIVQNWDQILENHLHLVLGVDHLKEVLTAVKTVSLKSSKTIELIKDWGKWQCCEQNLGQNFFPGLVDPVLAAALKSSSISYQANIIDAPESVCTVTPYSFDFLRNVFEIRELNSETTLFSIATNKRVVCAGIKLYIVTTSLQPDGLFRISQDNVELRFTVNQKQHGILGNSHTINEIQITFEKAVLIVTQGTFKITNLYAVGLLYLPIYQNKKLDDLNILKCAHADVTFKYLHSCVENVTLKRGIAMAIRKHV